MLSAIATGRITFLDGLRGIAAFFVVAHHMSMAVVDELNRSADHFVHGLVAYGAVGVDIFFILSGFVIAMTLDRQQVTARYAACFMVRRSLRLDPPYLCTLAIIIAITYASIAIGAQLATPTLPQLLAHVFYLQNILGYHDLNPVNWTLCLEIQFYLVLVLCLALLQRAFSEHRTAELLQKRGVQIGFVALALVSATSHGNYFESPIPHLFIEQWYQFFLGALTYWCRRGYLPQRWVVIYIVVVFGISLSGKPNAGDLIAAGTALMLLWMNSNRVLDSAPLQFLGRISYSLYLVHIPIGWAAIAVVGRIFQHESPLFAVGVGVFGMVVSLVAAYLMYRIVEAPSVRISRRIGDKCSGRVRSAEPLPASATAAVQTASSGG
jgi:peptidoglycan/LPS O-acetylase OafA/YrhL